ncbi:hypothetical protein BJL90_14880 [Clostridium formicaceticum]|uniref:Uncharacterized protein n=1 Tax=Clostridium formicaceticum TaxID=1497 RepID=A0ABM6EV90_9CLOT|nr:hypothetical protein BJL90_14880 [Clostridium formicaceticum]
MIRIFQINKIIKLTFSFKASDGSLCYLKNCRKFFKIFLDSPVRGEYILKLLHGLLIMDILTVTIQENHILMAFGIRKMKMTG